jgi:hypothetical protein
LPVVGAFMPTSTEASMRRVLRAILPVLVLLTAQTASAVPIQWTLDGVTFIDGGTASGSFVFDADLSIYSSINTSTTAGSTCSPALLILSNTRSTSEARNSW